jgi:hypothetical protein
MKDRFSLLAGVQSSTAPRPRGRDDELPSRRATKHRRSRWLLYFVLFEIVCQLGLLTSLLAPFRFVFRTASFGASLGLLWLLPGRAESLSGMARPIILVIVILALSLLNPTSNTLMASGAQIALYLAIVAPLFWVPRCRPDLSVLRGVLLMFWAFHTCSAFLGVLQVYFPGRFQPAISSVMYAMGGVENLQYRNAFGALVFRPMGLTDQPGGASGSGLYAALFGIAFFTIDPRRSMRLLYTISIIAGIACIYLSQTRSVLIMMLLCIVTFVAVNLMRRLRLTAVGPKSRSTKQPHPRLVSLVMIIVVTAAAGSWWAFHIGGSDVSGKFSTLLTPSQTYQGSRGAALERDVSGLLTDYPLGAGLGRWGMMNYYFGDNSNPENAGLWSETQWTGWLIDGGIPLVLAYLAAIFLAFKFSLRMALHSDNGELALWAAVVFAFNVAAFADTFDFAFFISQGGMDFWLFNAMLFSAGLECKVVRAAKARPAQTARSPFPLPTA